MIYEVDNASLEAAGSRVYGSVLVKVRTPLPEVADEEVLLDDELQLLKILARININAKDKYIIFFKADLSFSL
jgi:hypothetical protein